MNVVPAKHQYITCVECGAEAYVLAEPRQGYTFYGSKEHVPRVCKSCRDNNRAIIAATEARA